MDRSTEPTSLERLDSFEMVDNLNQTATEDIGNSDAANEKREESGGSMVPLPPPDERGRSLLPTYTRMSRRHLSPSVLNRYKIDYVFEDNDPGFILVKRWVPEYEQDFLWAATKDDREKKQLEKREFERRRIESLREKREKGEGDDGKGKYEAEVVGVNRGTKGEELGLEINRVPRMKWTEFGRSGLRGKHVLDVAMKLREEPTVPVTDSSPTAIDAGSVPVRLAVNSTHVAHELSKIADIDFRPGDVIIPPWKPLVIHYDAITTRFQELKQLQNEKRTANPREEEKHSTDVGKDNSSKKESSDEKKVRFSAEPTKPESVPIPCEVCELTNPPHDTLLECLDIRVSHLQCLLDFLNNDLKDIVSLRRDLAAGTTQKIAFSHLYHLFNPGDTIISPTNRQVYQVFHTSGGRPLLSKHVGFSRRPVITPFRIDCFYIDFDQRNLGPVYEIITIFPFDGTRQITSLIAEIESGKYFRKASLFPVRFLDGWERVRGELVERGRRLKRFGCLAHKRYRGVPAIEDIDEERQGVNRRRYEIFSCIGVNPEYITSDIILDFERDGKLVNAEFPSIKVDWRETADGCTHYGQTQFIPLHESTYLSDCDCSDIFPDEIIDHRRAKAYKKDLHLLKLRDPNDILTDEHFMLLPSVIKGFVLQKRAWMHLYVDLIQDLDWEKEKDSRILKRKSGLDDLVIPEGYWDLLEGLIATRPSTRLPRGVWFPAEGKSVEAIGGHEQGLIILLHGGSGRGKTSTAESIAAYTRHPLYLISFDDLPLDAIDMEEHLEIHLTRAQDWNSICLLSDIDSLLSRTSTKNNNQGSLNPIVSALCRILDNNRGIFILTAKDLSSIGQEVLSRIHVSLHFPRFDQEITLRVWEKKLDLMRRDGVVKVDEGTEKEILGFAEREYVKGARWDGRQIRNCLQTAASLARYSSGKQSPEAKGPPSLTLEAVENAAKSMSYLVPLAKS